MEEDIKRCKKLAEPQNANWIGISNQLAITHLIEKIKELEAKQEIKQIVDKIPVEEIEERIKIDIMSEETFNELIDNFEVVETLTEYGRKAIKQNVKKLQKRIKELEAKQKEMCEEYCPKTEKIKELEAKLEFKNWGDLDNIQFEEYMNQFIPKQKVKDLIKNETINISGFECIAVEDIRKLLEDK